MEQKSTTILYRIQARLNSNHQQIFQFQFFQIRQAVLVAWKYRIARIIQTWILLWNNQNPSSFRLCFLFQFFNSLICHLSIILLVFVFIKLLSSSVSVSLSLFVDYGQIWKVRFSFDLPGLFKKVRLYVKILANLPTFISWKTGLLHKCCWSILIGDIHWSAKIISATLLLIISSFIQ